MRINAHVASVQAARADYPYGQTARIPVALNASNGLVRAGIPADTPTNAVVQSADLVLYARGAATGSRALSAQMNTTDFHVSTATWTNRPGVAGTVHSTTVGAVAAKTEIRISVTADVAAFIAGTATNHGWRLSSNSATSIDLYGSTADQCQPWLVIDYLEPGEAPIDLSPDGAAVSIAKPVLRAVSVDEVIAVQVQVDPAANPTSPAFDSGEVPATAPELDLATTSYSGLSNGSTTSWRIMVKTALGWSDYSEWATFTRTAKITTTIISPLSTTGDTTPTVVWTAVGQVTWRARLYNDASGKLIASSGWVTSSDHAWTPPKGLKREGQVGRFELQVLDGVDRVATPGDSIYSTASSTTTLVAESADPGVAYLNGAQDGLAPIVRLTWPAGSPSGGWQVVRDGEWLDKIGATATHWVDRNVLPGFEHTYRILPKFSDGTTSHHGPTARVQVNPFGLWLLDPDTDQTLLVLDEQFAGDTAERAVLHEVLDGPAVRRRISSPPPKGTVTGNLLDDPNGDLPLDDMLATAYDFKGSDASRVYRLVYGSWNVPVTIEDLSALPFDAGTQRGFTISFGWRQTDDEIPWED